MKKLLTNQKGFGLVLVIGVAVVILIIIGVIIYFLLKGGADSKKQQDQNSNANSSTTTQPTITEDQVPLKVCETGDPDQCHDPIPNSVVDQIKVDDLP